MSRAGDENTVTFLLERTGPKEARGVNIVPESPPLAVGGATPMDHWDIKQATQFTHCVFFD